MFSISREFSFCYGHRLLGHPGRCGHPHGHNGRALVTLAEPKLNANGMVRDFTELKTTIGNWIDENLDHKMILSLNDPLVPLLAELNEPVFLTNSIPTAEALAKLIFDAAAQAGFPVQKVEFWETPKCSAIYQKEA